MSKKKSQGLKLLRDRRDAKVQHHLEQYAPVWLVDEIPFPQDSALQFNVVFYHPAYGWVNRRYRYDSATDVLYHKGQTQVSEADALALEEQKPYIAADAVNTVDSYGG